MFAESASSFVNDAPFHIHTSHLVGEESVLFFCSSCSGCAEVIRGSGPCLGAELKNHFYEKVTALYQRMLVTAASGSTDKQKTLLLVGDAACREAMDALL